MRKFNSIFSQLLGIFSRADFSVAVKRHGAERAAKGFDCWTQFVAMLFCQLGRAHSLREICSGLASVEGKLNHLGVGDAPKRSTLSYANAHRPAALFKEVFFQVLERCQSAAAPKPFRFRHKLYSLDASVIDLCMEVFDWAKYRRTKGAIKLHLLLDHDGHLPCFAVVSEGRLHEVNVARGIDFAPDSLVTFDRGYLDFNWLGTLDDRGVFFVTRTKSNTVWLDEGDMPGPSKRPHSGVISDKLVTLPGAPQRLWRRVEWFDQESNKTLVFLTNHFKLSATTVAAVYRQRWQIELFFKALKQNLKIKTFVGTSANAVEIQIWTALVAIVLLKYLQMKSRWGWSLSNLVALLRINLFTHKNLWSWIDDPLTPPPEDDVGRQAQFSFA